MTQNPKKLPARFYRTAIGNEPVREWLLKLDDQDRRTIGIDIARVEFGWPIGMPYSRSLGGGVWEVRSNISDERITRVLFGILDGYMILLHAFVKKTQTTPVNDLDLARKRLKEIQS